MSDEQRQKLSAAQKAYVASDPRWAEHRQKLADAQIGLVVTPVPKVPFWKFRNFNVLQPNLVITS